MANTSDYYITSQGVIVPDTSTVLSEVEADWKALFGEDFDVSPFEDKLSAINTALSSLRENGELAADEQLTLQK